MRCWTTKEDQYMRYKYPTLRTDEIAKELDRSENAIRKRAYKLGIIKTIRMNRRSPEELAKLQKKIVRIKYNPNPITPMTIKMICWYTEDGDSVKEIAALIHRPKQKVQKILNECLLDGRYDRYSMERKERLEQSIKAGQSLILTLR